MALRPVRGGAAATSSRPWAGVQPLYEDFRPMSEWKQDEESDILLVFLPGFMRQHLKVSTEGKNIVRVRGERLVAGNKWSRFQEDYQVPENCNIRAVGARFEGGTLTITMAKKDIQAPQVGSKEAAKATPPTEIPPKSISSQDTDLKQQMSPQKAPIEPRPQKGVDEIHPEVLDPRSVPQKAVADLKQQMGPPKAPIEPRPQKGADEIHPKVFDPLSVPQKVDDGIRPKVLDLPSVPQKGADEIHPKVLNPPSVTPDKGKDAKISQLQPQKGQDEQTDRASSPKPKPVTPLMTSVNDGVEKKKIISSETKAKPAKSENIEDLKEVSDDKKSIEKSKEAVPSLAENLTRIIAKEKEKSKKIEEKGKYTGKKEKQTTTTIASTSNDYGLGNYKKSVKNLAEMTEEKQLLVNIGVAVLVIVALGTYISYTTGSSEA